MHLQVARGNFEQVTVLAVLGCALPVAFTIIACVAFGLLCWVTTAEAAHVVAS